MMRRGMVLVLLVLVAVVPSGGGEPRVVLEERYSGSGGGCGSGATAASWSPDARWLLLVRPGITASIAADCSEFAVVGSAGGKAVTLGASPNPRWAVWNPGQASRLAFVDGTGRMTWRQKQLRLASPPWAEAARSLTPAGHADREPAWDPSGRYLAFTRSLAKEPAELREAAPEQRIQVLDTLAGVSRPVPGSEGGYGPFWGRDGSLFWLMPEGDSADLWALRGGRAAPLIRGLKRHEYYGQWTGQDLLDTP